MRLVIEVTEAERDALRHTLASLGSPPPTYSALFRALLRLTADGTVPRAKVVTALGERPVLKVTVQAAKAAKGPETKEKRTAAQVFKDNGWDIPKKK
jgi:hypothetical protein